MRRNLTPDDLGDLLELPILAILATHAEDGQILLSPVWHEWRDRGFSIITWAKDIKSSQLNANPKATVVVAEQFRPYRSIEVRGRAELSQPPDRYEILRRIACRYLGDDAGASYAEDYAGIEIELIRIVPGHIRAWDFNDQDA